MSRKDVVEKLIEAIRRVAERPAMYLGDVTAASASSFQCGTYCACAALGIDLPSKLLRQAVNGRGWEYGPTGGVADMREQGLSEDQIVQELILIKIRMLEIVAEGLTD